VATYKISLSDEQADKLADYLSGDVAEQIRAQIPKPAIEEPIDFGSIVFAGRGGSDRVAWTPNPASGAHYWVSVTGVIDVWSELTDVEVLRVGIGERQDVAPEDTEDYKAGVSDFAAKLTDRFIYRLQNGITAERRDADERAIKDVEELQP
jgi:hypothetical protein